MKSTNKSVVILPFGAIFTNIPAGRFSAKSGLRPLNNIIGGIAEPMALTHIAMVTFSACSGAKVDPFAAFFS